jgi:hypothetical protein
MTVEEKYNVTVGITHSFGTIVTDVLPQIRHILRTEHQRKERQPEQPLPESLWANVRKTRRQVKEVQEGRKKWFDDRVNAEAVLKTWLKVDIPGASDSAESMGLDTSI